MKKFILSGFIILMAMSINAQEKRKEVAINLTSFENFGLSYRFGTDKSLWRLNLLNSNVYTSSDEDEFTYLLDDEYNSSKNETDGFSIGFSVGKEFRNPIREKLEFRYGFDIGLDYSMYNYEFTPDNSDEEGPIYYTANSSSESFNPFLNGVIGFNFLLNKNLVLGIEVLPSITYRIGKNESTSVLEENGVIEEYSNSESDITGFAFNLNSDAARLSLAYRF